jgi:hypothetical protein
MGANASLGEILGTAAAFVAIGGGALGLCRGAMAWNRQTIGSMRSWQRASINSPRA